MFFKKLLLIVGFFIATAMNAVAASHSIIPSTEFFSTLKNSTQINHALIKSNSDINPKMFYQQMNDHSIHQLVTVEDKYLKLASGVQDSKHVWRFMDNNLNNKLIDLFSIITDNQRLLGFKVELSQYDLFHGHVFAVRTNNQVTDVGILFHAKEYPSDLPLGNPDANNSPFTSTSPGYKYRNFIWLASAHMIYDIDSDSTAIFPHYFLPEDVDPDDSSMQDIVSSYLKARTFIIDNLAAEVELLGDVNLFIIDNKPVIFLTG